MSIRRPEVSEYSERYAHYIALVPEADLPTAMLTQLADTAALLQGLPDQLLDHRYAEGKWTVREVLGHILDTERILSYRILTAARGGDATAFTRADENVYVRNGGYATRGLRSAIEEFASLRRSNVMMLAAMPEAAWDHTATMSGAEVTVRAIAYLMVGHERHHVNIIRERYL